MICATCKHRFDSFYEDVDNHCFDCGEGLPFDLPTHYEPALEEEKEREECF